MKAIKLDYLPPFRFEKLLDFFRMRAISGVEVVDSTSYARCARVVLTSGEEARGYFRVENDEDKNALMLSMSEQLLCVSEIIEARVRKQFDLDCNPEVVHAGLAPLERARKNTTELGVRLPGAFDAFETCCRAVLGQQISVSAANKLAARVVSAFGVPIKTEVTGLELAWPTPKEVLEIPDIESAFGKLGVIKNRTRAIVEIARLIESGKLTFGGRACSFSGSSRSSKSKAISTSKSESESAGTSTGTSAGVDANEIAKEQMDTLLQIRGIGPWTANYILMRVQSFTDAFLETDVGVVHALPNTTPKERLKIVESCKPWRSYAVMSLWNSLAGESTSSNSVGALDSSTNKENPREKSKEKSKAKSRKKAQTQKSKSKRKNIKSGAAKEQSPTIYFTEYESRLIGSLTIASDGNEILGCWFNNDRYFGYGVAGDMQRNDNLQIFKLVHEWFDAYFAGDNPNPRDLPLARIGTQFQNKVREAMLSIPYGKTNTYGNIAKEISAQTGRRPCAQAVGGAVGHNPFCVIVPCHRVVGSSGSLTGFGGGIDMKAKLLEHEGADMRAFSVPTHGTAIDPKTWT